MVSLSTTDSVDGRWMSMNNDYWWNDNKWVQPKDLEKTYPSASLYTTNHTALALNLGLQWVTNCLIIHTLKHFSTQGTKLYAVWTIWVYLKKLWCVCTQDMWVAMSIQNSFIPNTIPSHIHLLHPISFPCHANKWTDTSGLQNSMKFYCPTYTALTTSHDMSIIFKRH
jgi:hypothetical protein